MRISNFLKATAFLLSSLSPSAMFGAGCVEEVDTLVTFNLSGRLHAVPRVADFVAEISQRDLTNSKGMQLANFAAVLQQNRANVHKIGPTDPDDLYFTTAQRRSELSTGRYFTYCGEPVSLTRGLERDILNATVPGIVWVVAFQHPDGKLAFFITLVG